MKLSIEREACCAADDQMGPLELWMEVAPDTPLKDLVERIRHRRFLQYSSTHHTLYGVAAGHTLVSIGSEDHGDGKVVYFVEHTKTIGELIPEGRIRFSFAAADASRAHQAQPNPTPADAAVEQMESALHGQWERLFHEMDDETLRQRYRSENLGPGAAEIAREELRWRGLLQAELPVLQDNPARSVNKARTGYVPKGTSAWTRLGSWVGACVLVLYGAFGVVTDNLYVPFKHRPGYFLHGQAAWMMYGSMLCVAAVSLILARDHEVRRKNEWLYRLVIVWLGIAAIALYLLARQS